MARCPEQCEQRWGQIDFIRALIHIRRVKNGTKRVAALRSAAARLLTAYTKQIEVLRRLRHRSTQLVRAEHIHVNAGG